MNLRTLDLNLLLVFNAVYTDRSMTRAAQTLGMTQPAVSNALGRLRKHLGDPLFQRAGQGMEPTAEARRLAPALRDALKAIETVVSAGQEFDPTTSTREFSMIMSDALEPLIMGPLLQLRSTQSLSVRFSLQPLHRAEFNRSISSKDVDLGFFVIPMHEAHVRSSYLFSDTSTIVVRQDHPTFGDREQFTVDDLFSAPFVALSEDLRKITHIDQETRALGRSRQIACTTQRVWSLPYLAANSDLVAVLPTTMAESLSDKLALKLFEPPIDIPPQTWYMAWHDDFENDQGHAWLRATIRQITADHHAPKQLRST